MLKGKPGIRAGAVLLLLLLAFSIAVVLPVMAVQDAEATGGTSSDADQMTTKDVPVKDPENFTDPVTLKVKRMRSKGMNNVEIQKALKEKGLGWSPSTGATWRGRSPTPKELRRLPPRRIPFNKSTRYVPSTDTSQANQVMETDNEDFTDEYRGITTHLTPGSLAIGSSETKQHVATTHVGRGGYWIEGGVVRTLGDTDWRLFTYDNDEGGWKFHGTTSYSSESKIQIYVQSDYDYNIWIDGTWVRSGTLTYVHNNVDQANEVWSDTGVWTSDWDSAEFGDTYLYTDSDRFGGTTPGKQNGGTPLILVQYRRATTSLAPRIYIKQRFSKAKIESRGLEK